MRFSVRFVAALALGAMALLEAAYGLWFGPVVAGAITLDPSGFGWLGAVGGGIVGLVLIGLALILSLVTALSAVGIAAGHPAGWWLALVASGGWLLTGCAPLAAVSIVVLLLPDVRAIAFPPAPGQG